VPTPAYPPAVVDWAPPYIPPFELPGIVVPPTVPPPPPCNPETNPECPPPPPPPTDDVPEPATWLLLLIGILSVWMALRPARKAGN